VNCCARIFCRLWGWASRRWRTGISGQHLDDILNERKPVSPEVSVRLGKAFGDGAGVWLRMQAAYDAWQAERSVDVSKVKLIRAA